MAVEQAEKALTAADDEICESIQAHAVAEDRSGRLKRTLQELEEFLSKQPELEGTADVLA